MKKKKKRSLAQTLLIALIVLSVAALVYVIGFYREGTVAIKPSSEPDRRTSQSKAPAKDKQQAPAQGVASHKTEKDMIPSFEPDVKPSRKEKIVVAKIIPPRFAEKEMAIIIDDIGYDLKPVYELIRIEEEITFAVLPLLPHSREADRLLQQSGREVLLHLPMEPVSYPDEKPGSGALFTDMSDEEIVRQLEKNLASVPHAVGVNNHMGSKFMADEEKLTPVFRTLKSANLFFVDSRTTPSSKSAAVARKTNLPLVSRKVFLDHDRNYDKIYAVLMDVARAPAGTAPLIAIGHPYPETIRAIRDARRVLREKGVSIIPVSRMIKKQTAEDAF